MNKNNNLRFSIRKLTIGAASVMLGATIFGVSANQVHAETEQHEQNSSSVVSSDTRNPEANSQNGSQTTIKTTTSASNNSAKGSSSVSSSTTTPAKSADTTQSQDKEGSQLIKYMNRDENGSNTVGSKIFTKKIGEQITYDEIKNGLPAGYAFKRGQIIPASIKLGEQNPDLTIWLDPLQTETNHYIRIIHYKYANGTTAALDNTFTFDFTRTQHVDKNGYADGALGIKTVSLLQPLLVQRLPIMLHLLHKFLKEW